MLQVARLAPRLLGDATDRVREFFESQIAEDGGGRDRAGFSDLYYTVFALEGLISLQAELPVERIRGHLESFGSGEGLDLVHLSCLARCWAALPKGNLDSATADALAENLSRFRSADGGFAAEGGATRGTVYHGFLGLGAYQDVGRDVPNATLLPKGVLGLRSQDGGFANQPDLAAGSTTVTAAATTMLRYLGQAMPVDVAPWLLARMHPLGGFAAAPDAPMPDLLSTATALHALVGLGVDLTSVKEPCLDYIDTLWTGRAFCGHWADDDPDAEYTWYALLALGHLSL